MRKLSLGWVVAVALAIVNIALAVHDFAPAGSTFGPGQSLLKAHDFLLRRNEARCVLAGIDPYDVWMQKVVLPPYYPYVRQELRSASINEPINAYTPWEYSFAFIYALLPKQVAWVLHFALMVLALGTVCIFAFRAGGPWSVAAVLAYVIPANIDMNVGNYPLIIAAVFVGMAASLQRRRNLSAGLLWVVAMFKPQLGVQLAVPLLVERRIAVCLTTAVLCCLLMIPAVVLVGASPVRLILEAPAASAHAFEGCALMPAPLLDVLTAYATGNVWMLFAMVIGLVACMALTWRLRKSEDWLVLMLPSILCSVAWTYVQPHSYVVTMPLAAWLAKDMVGRRTPGRLAMGLPAICLFAGFARGLEIIVAKVVPPLAGMVSQMTSLSATVAFVLGFSYLWRYAGTAGKLFAADERVEARNWTGRGMSRAAKVALAELMKGKPDR